jgi:hypothetical protein
MRRIGATLLLLVLLAGCGKYGAPRRVRPEPPAPAQAETVDGAQAPADEEEPEEAQ